GGRIPPHGKAPPPALAAKIHAPAVSELRKPKPSRRTPPGGVPAQGGNVLQAIVGSQASEPMPIPRPQTPPPDPPPQPQFPNATPGAQPQYTHDASGLPMTPPSGVPMVHQHPVPGVPPHLQPYLHVQGYPQYQPGYPPVSPGGMYNF